MGFILVGLLKLGMCYSPVYLDYLVYIILSLGLPIEL